jgi:hypothetical protein
MTPAMKKVVLMAVGAVALYQAAKKYGINSFEDLRNTFKKLIDGINLKEWVNVHKLKEMVAPVAKVAKNQMATA